MTIISERLQHLRLTHGYTQTDLARTMGVTRRTVYAWEHDKCPEIPHLIHQSARRQPQRSIFLTAHL